MFVFVADTSFFSIFALQLKPGPPFSSEIRPCMLNHLVELEAVQAVYSLQNGFTGVSLNSHGEIERVFLY